MCPGVGIALLILVFPFMPIITHRHIKEFPLTLPIWSGFETNRVGHTTKIDNRSFSISLFIDVIAESTNEHIELLTQILKDEVDVQGKRGFHIEP